MPPPELKVLVLLERLLLDPPPLELELRVEPLLKLRPLPELKLWLLPELDECEE